ncbi:MAG TPA: diacylglycerol kinase family protein [Thermoanaerobaculaceae bacterium]|nr:diacylglycerol kinase family protein [Thermoanaerobaculaceae bacterium]HPS76882.1 diacylglycerol kinase family protein [Thermoanaerobaculaceae bacterium]
MGTQRFFLAARLESFRYAGKGIAVMMRSQHNAWLHAMATVVVCAVAFYLGVTRDEWCSIVLTMVTVWTAEALNTALELLANAVAPTPHPLIKKAKDVAAGAVLLAVAGAIIVGVLILGPRLVALF